MKQPEEFYKLEASNWQTRTPAEVFSCGFGKASGWAILIIHSETGTVAIHSDYGDWTFSWSKAGLGERTIKEFLCYSGRGCYDYLANKFMQGVKDVFDKDATVRRLQDLIAEACDDKPITWHEDRCKEMNEWLEEEAPDNAELFYERLPEDFHKLLDGNPVYEEFVYDKPHEFYWLRDGVLPALINELRKTMPKQEEVAQ